MKTPSKAHYAQMNDHDLLVEVATLQDETRAQVEKQNGNVAALQRQMRDLPCRVNNLRLQTLEETGKEHRKVTTSRRNQIIVAITSAGITATIMYIVSTLTG